MVYRLNNYLALKDYVKKNLKLLKNGKLTVNLCGLM